MGQALAHLKPPENLRATVSFEVADWVVSADKPLAATVQVEGGQVQVLEKADKDALCCDINTFTQLFARRLDRGPSAGHGAFEWRQSDDGGGLRCVVARTRAVSL